MSYSLNVSYNERTSDGFSSPVKVPSWKIHPSSLSAAVFSIMRFNLSVGAMASQRLRLSGQENCRHEFEICPSWFVWILHRLNFTQPCLLNLLIHLTLHGLAISALVCLCNVAIQLCAWSPLRPVECGKIRTWRFWMNYHAIRHTLNNISNAILNLHSSEFLLNICEILVEVLP